MSGKTRVVGEFFQFLREEKKFWLVPVAIVFILLGLFIVLTQSSILAPLIYPLF